MRAYIYVLIYAAVVGLAIHARSILPLMFVGLPAVYGSWLQFIYGHTQHAGLAENVLDHRLNSRTIYLGPIHRYLYWEMNYHLEHHLFPLVPYHKLARLHELIKADMPRPYHGLLDAWREIMPTLLRQRKEPAYYIRRELPAEGGDRRPISELPAGGLPETAPAPFFRPEGAAGTRIFTAKGRPVDGWVEICASGFLRRDNVIRFDHDGKTYAVYRVAGGNLYATDGVCTHGAAHLADGYVSGMLIECPKHNGRFCITDGQPRRQPVCVPLKTYQARERYGKIFLNLAPAGGSDAADLAPTFQFRVVSNENVATFIKELVLKLEPGSPPLAYRPGDYLQFIIPAYDEILFDEIAVGGPFTEIWKAQGVWGFRAENALPIRRNYSFATAPGVDRQLRFNVRLSTPRAGAIAAPGPGRLTFIASGRAIRSRPLGRSAISASSPRNGKWSTSAAVRAWRPCARTWRTCWSTNGPAAASVSGTAPARCWKASTAITSRTWPASFPTSVSTWRSPSRNPRTTGRRTPG